MFEAPDFWPLRRVVVMGGEEEGKAFKFKPPFSCGYLLPALPFQTSWLLNKADPGALKMGHKSVYLGGLEKQ